MSLALVEAEDLLDGIRRVVREEVSAAGVAAPEPEGYFNTESARKYLDTSQEAIRSAVKQGKLRPLRRGAGRNARLLFTRQQLDAYARGERS